MPKKDDSTNKLSADAAALASLKSSSTPPLEETTSSSSAKPPAKGGGKKSCCPSKQIQLPMFLTKTYHMIDKCDPTICTWSDAGDNFVVKDLDKFSTTVLPCYFKHSNFSSFARQLNFYGFRKLKAEPVLMADYDKDTACHVRFYHEKFQRDQPELLADIKRATKGEQQSKDEVDHMKMEFCQLKETVQNLQSDFERRMAEMSYEYNRRITTLSAEYDKLAVLVQQLLAQNGGSSEAALPADMLQSLTQAAALTLHNVLVQPPAAPAAGIAAAAQPAVAAGQKRPAEEEQDDPSSSSKQPAASRPRAS